LSSHIAEPFAELHPQDARDAGITAADLIEVKSPHGSAVVRAQITDRAQKGSVFVPMHWTDQVSSRGRIDAVVAPETDPVSGQPGSKFTPVAIRKLEFAWHGFAVLRDKPDQLDTGYWAIAPTEGGWRVELAGDRFTNPEDLAGRLLPEDTEFLRFEDGTTGALRIAGWTGANLAGAFFFAPDPVAVSRPWASGLLTAETSTKDQRFRVLAGRPPADLPDKGAIVCSCFQVGSSEIAAEAAKGATTVKAIGACLKAGTNCGSCRSEIQTLLDAVAKETREDADIAQAS
jgi:assimilatory nitrate reductase catalytic subunit